MTKHLIICFLWLSIYQSQAQEKQTFKFDYTIESKEFGDQRDISVYLPPSYYSDENVDYTVTYMLDGQHDPFVDMGAKIIEYGTYNYKYTPTIVVGIHAKQRGWEFSAHQEGDEEYDYQGGRAPELQSHFRDEVFPFIENLNLRIKPFRTLIGHSSGGGFVIYTLFGNSSDLFDAYVAISPALRDDDEYIFDVMEERLLSSKPIHKFLYCSSGSVGEREELFGAVVKRIDSTLSTFPDHKLLWHHAQFEGTGHWSCVAPSINDAMIQLTRQFRVDEKLLHEFARNEKSSIKDQIDEHYTDLEKLYGFREIPTSSYLNSIAWEISNRDDNHSALELYNWTLEHYPNDYRITKSKAKLELKMGLISEAEKSFKRCVDLLQLGESEGHVSKERFIAQSKYLAEKLADLKG